MLYLSWVATDVQCAQQTKLLQARADHRRSSVWKTKAKTVKTQLASVQVGVGMQCVSLALE